MSAQAPAGRPVPGGFFVTLEGVDGAGKSTQARLLAEALEAEGLAVVRTREPGGSPGAEEIRRLLVSGDPGRWSARTEALLFTAARRDHLERLIEPALAAGKVVVSDRFADSTRVYQGARAPELRAFVDALHALAIGREPDLTLILEVDPARALARGRGPEAGEGRFEAMGLPFQRRLAEGFRALAREFPGRCVLIDGERPAEAVAAEIRALVLERLEARAAAAEGR